MEFKLPVNAVFQPFMFSMGGPGHLRYGSGRQKGLYISACMKLYPPKTSNLEYSSCANDVMADNKTAADKEINTLKERGGIARKFLKNADIMPVLTARNEVIQPTRIR